MIKMLLLFTRIDIYILYFSLLFYQCHVLTVHRLM